MAARVASSLLAAAALCATSHASAVVDTTVAAVTDAEVVTTTTTTTTFGAGGCDANPASCLAFRSDAMTFEECENYKETTTREERTAEQKAAFLAAYNVARAAEGKGAVTEDDLFIPGESTITLCGSITVVLPIKPEEQADFLETVEDAESFNLTIGGTEIDDADVVSVEELGEFTTTAPTCYDTVFDVSSDEAIATAWSITPGENGGYFRHNRHRNRESGGVLVLRNGLDARRGGAAGDSYITASFPHAGSVALVSATIEGGTLRTADDACTFSASGDNGATWTEVVQVDRDDDGQATDTAVISVPAGEIIFKFQIDSDGKREKCYLADARANCF